MAVELLALRSVTFYFGALVFNELTRHSVRRRKDRAGEGVGVGGTKGGILVQRRRPESSQPLH